MDVVASSITFVSTIISAYNAISGLNQLPQEFQEVERRLPLVDNTLRRIQGQLREELIDDSTESTIRDSLSRCDDFGRKLKDIFDGIQAYDTREGSALMRYKKTLVSKGKQIGKAHRVETLMTGMLTCVKDLADNYIFRLATQDQVAQLSSAIDALSHIMSSVTDADFNRAGYATSQNIASGGTGNQGIQNGDGAFNNSGGNTIHSNGGPTLLHATGTFNFGNQEKPCNQETGAEKGIREKYEKRRAKVMKSLAPLPYTEAKNRNKERLEGTCVWFKEHEKFQQWSSTTESSFLFVSADPGCGKSVLSRHLVDSILPCLSASTIVCYFFFKEDIELQASAINALRCVLHQIFTARLDLLTSDILNTFEHNDNTIKSIDELWKVLLTVTSTEKCKEVICVFDALDECPEHERVIFSHAVRSHFEKPSPHSRLKLFITSRPYRHVMGKLLPRALYMESCQEREASVIHLRGETQEEVDKIAAEIDIVIQDEVDNMGAAENWSKVEVECVKSQLRLVPNRTYLWAHLTIDWLKKESGLRLSDFKSLSKRIPQTVDQAYERILCRARDRRPEILKLLQVVVAATRALTLDEMDFALSIRPDHKTCEEVEVMGGRFEIYIRDLCGLFVSIVDSKVYFLHQTAKEFLVQNWATVTSSSSWKHTLGIEDAHKTMFQICSSTMLALENHPREPDQPNYRLKEVYREKCALFDYSVDHFNTHYKSSAEEQYSVLDALLNIDSEKRYEDPYDDPLCFTMGRKPSLTRCDSAGTPLFVSLHFGWGSYTRQLLHSERHAWELWIPSDCEVRDPLLIVAARSGDAELLRELLSHVDKTRQAELVNECDKDRNTSVLVAAENSNLECVTVLIEAGADINAANEDGLTALFYACVAENIEICEHLLKRDASLFDKSYCISKIFLLLGKEDFLRDVLGKERMAQEFSDLYTQVYLHSNEESPLLGYCDINLVGYKGLTPLTFLLRDDHYGDYHDDFLRDFINRGANIMSADGNGHTPLWYCTRPGVHVLIGEVYERTPPEYFKRADKFLLLLTTKPESQLSSDERTHISKVVDTLFAYACKYDNTILACNLYTADLRRFQAKDTRNMHLILAIATKREDIVEFLMSCDHGGYSVSAFKSIMTMAWLASQETVIGAFLPMLQSTDAQSYNTFLSLMAFPCKSSHTAFDYYFIQNHTYAWLKIYSDANTLIKKLDDNKAPIEMQIDLLQRYGADINARDEDGQTALFHADSYDVVKELLKKGADANARDNEGKTALFLAWSSDVVKELLKMGGDVDTRDKTGKTALFYARSDDVVRELLRKGADINARDNDGKTALSYAWPSRVVKELLKMGADVDTRDKTGKTALFYARSSDLANELLEMGADVNARDKHSRTALFYTTKFTVIEKLVNHGADIEAKDDHGFTPFIFYILASKLAWAMELADHGANINARDQHDRTALFHIDSLDVVRHLLKKGADIEAKDADGSTPLLFHIAKSELTIAMELIRHGADVTQMNSRGETALRLAFHHEIMAVKFDTHVDGVGYIETSECATVVAMLRSAGASFEDGLLFCGHSAHMRSLIENWPCSVQRHSGSPSRPKWWSVVMS